MVVARCLVSLGFGILGDAGRSMIVQKPTFPTWWLGSFEKQLPLLLMQYQRRHWSYLPTKFLWAFCSVDWCIATVLQQIPQMGAVRNKTPLLKPKTTRIADQNLCQIIPYVANCLGGHDFPCSAHVQICFTIINPLRLDDLILEMVKFNAIVWSQVDL